MTYEFYSGLIVGIISGACLLILLRTLIRSGNSHSVLGDNLGMENPRRTQPFIPMSPHQMNYLQDGEDASVQRIKEKLHQFKIRNDFYMEADESSW